MSESKSSVSESATFSAAKVPSSAGPVHPPQGAAVVGIHDLLIFLRRRWRVIGAVTLLSLMLGTLYCVFKTRRYSATAALAIYPEGSNALSIEDITSNLGGMGFDEKIGTQVQILRSKSLAWTVISELRMDRIPEFAGTHGWFARKWTVPPAPDDIEKTSAARRNELITRFETTLTVQNIPRTQEVDIVFTNARPELAREVVNHLTSAYSRRNFITRFNETMKASEWLSQQLNELKSKVQQSQESVGQFQRQTGIFGADENNNLVLSRLDALSKELTDAEADRIVKEAKYRIAQSGNAELIGTLVPDSVLPVLRSQEVTLRNQIAQANTEYLPKYPRVVELNSQLAQLESSLKKEIGDIQERFRTDYQASKDTEDRFRTAFNQQKQEAFQMSEGLSRYGILKREAESGSDLYEDLMRKLQEAGVIASLKATAIEIIDAAPLPTVPVEPKITVVMLISLVLGFIAGLALGFLAETLDNKIRTPMEAESLAGFPLFGWLPHISGSRAKAAAAAAGENGGPPNNSIVTLLRPQSQAAEAFRSLRTSLLLASAASSPRTVLVTSGIPGDGKSTVSLNLAITLAQAEGRVLLVDSDLRRGLLHKLTNLEPNPGLSGVLAGTANWRDQIVQMPEKPNLFLLQAGIRPPNPAELLGSAQMDRLIAEWTAEFDRVVFDSAPCAAVTDPVLVARHTDAVLLLTRVGHTPRAALRRSADLLRSSGSPIVGLIVNDVGQQRLGYGYGYGYGYGSDKYNGYYSED